MRKILLVLAVAFGFSVASTAFCQQATKCPNKALCPSPQQPEPTPPPQFDFPDDVDVDVHVDTEAEAETADESVLTTILSAVAALGGAASGYFGTREDPDDPETAADEVVPEPPVVA